MDREYYQVFCNANDSLKHWKDNNLNSYKYLELYPYKLDSLLCCNKEKNKIVSAILISDKQNNGNNSDGLIFFYGVKIKEQWYFFTGATVVLPRENYQQDAHTPLSFAKLHEIAMQEVFSGYLIETKTKKNLGWWKNTFSPEYEYEYQINDKFFEGMETKNQSGRGYGSCFECKTFEEYVLYLVQRNWQKK